MKPASWPRYMVEKRLASGVVAYYWSPQRRDVANGCPVHAEALGPDYGIAVARAAELNEHLDCWRAGRDASKSIDSGPRFGTVDWWIERYTRTEAFTSLALRSRDDYREALERLANLPTELRDASGGSQVRIGALPVCSLSPAAVDKLYAMLRAGGAIRQANLPDRRCAPRMEGGCAPVSGRVSHSEPFCPARAHPS